MVLAAGALAPGLLLLFCLALLCRSWNQSLRRSPRSARSCPVQLSAEAGEEREKMMFVRMVVVERETEKELKRKRKMASNFVTGELFFNTFGRVISCSDSLCARSYHVYPLWAWGWRLDKDTDPNTSG